MSDIDTLLQGYKKFYEKHFVKDSELYEQLSTVGQFPKTLIIACSDSRVDPSIITEAQAGDIFVIRNVANLVPPYQPKADSYHGTSAALEFAVCNLKIENIVILGHSRCAGIKALMDQEENNDKFSFIFEWVKIALEAKKKAKKAKDLSVEEMDSCCEKESIIVSLKNLLTFPWLKEKVDNGSLNIYGWYFSISDGKLFSYDEKQERFSEVP